MECTTNRGCRASQAVTHCVLVRGVVVHDQLQGDWLHTRTLTSSRPTRCPPAGAVQADLGEPEVLAVRKPEPRLRWRR